MLRGKGCDELISLNYRDTSPIYEQVKTEFKSMILKGAVAEDEKLPSVRELAMQLAINPNTIQRAYRELEQEGFIYSIAGRGSFVSGGTDVKKKHIEEKYDAFDSAVKELIELGIGKDELIERIKEGGEEND